MTFECLLNKTGKFIVSKPQGWEWSDREHTEFEVMVIEIDQENIPETVTVGNNEIPVEMLGIARSM
jgi:hypothetical protein